MFYHRLLCCGVKTEPAQGIGDIVFPWRASLTPPRARRGGTPRGICAHALLDTDWCLQPGVTPDSVRQAGSGIVHVCGGVAAFIMVRLCPCLSSCCLISPFLSHFRRRALLLTYPIGVLTVCAVVPLSVNLQAYMVGPRGTPIFEKSTPTSARFLDDFSPEIPKLVRDTLLGILSPCVCC